MRLRILLKYFLLVAVLFLGLQVYAQSSDCLTRTTVITVLGPRGKDAASPLNSLSPEDLNVKVDGKSVSIESVTRSARPRRVGIVADVGSRQSKSTWDATVSIIRKFPSQFSENTEFSLVAFDDKVEQKVSLQRGSHALDEFVDTLSPSKNKESKGGLYAGLAAGISTLGTPQTGDALFLITAWEDAGESDEQRGIVQSLSAAGVRLFGISFDSSRLPGVPPKGAFVSLQSFTPIDAIAKSSGGLWERATGSGAELDLLPKSSASVMADFYTVGLRLAQPLVKAEQMKIELVKGGRAILKSNLPRRDVFLSYPQSLYPCR